MLFFLIFVHDSDIKENDIRRGVCCFRFVKFSNISSFSLFRRL